MQKHETREGDTVRSPHSAGEPEIVSLLNGLVEACHDAEAGFRQSAGDVTNPSLKAIFTRFSVQRAEFASELAGVVRSQGGAPEHGGTVSGALRRGWVDLKAALTGRDDDQILKDVEAAEGATRHVYEEAMRRVLPVEVQAVITRQYDAVRRAHDQIQDLRRVRG